ncbi:hypothetical protein GN157_00070 [Flavobacterium rakeshii]|uniref:Uncharacterized protein n=1 Tax=Flavobacterium rakeshii TaxID=1038845 RepID=A0A6N8H737_9FLAO|nr:hypothetical protein [Flavobacterium rakeshii]MUV02092.1 hypothetical protein [Flavobacterium rakeshii]
MGDIKYIFLYALEISVLILAIWFGFIIISGIFAVFGQFFSSDKMENFTPKRNDYIKQHQKLIARGYDTRIVNDAGITELVYNEEEENAEDVIIEKKKKKKKK